MEQPTWNGPIYSLSDVIGHVEFLKVRPRLVCIDFQDLSVGYELLKQENHCR